MIVVIYLITFQHKPFINSFEIYPVPMTNDNLLQTIQSECTPLTTHKKSTRNLICLYLKKTNLV